MGTGLVSKQVTPQNVDMSKFQDRLDAFVFGAQDIINKHFATNLTILTPPALTVEHGKRYIKIVRTDAKDSHGRAGQSSVHCFIDSTNGNLLMAASFRAPAKHSRGNIFNDDNALSGMSPWGAKYLK